MTQPGRIILLGSGETSPHGLAVLRHVFQTETAPQRVAILETPAGFQPNSGLVAGEVARAFQTSLGEFIHHIDVIPARSKDDWTFSPDNPEVIAPLDEATCLFAGPGSPTYAVRHLAGTAALRALAERWCAGATLILSSAALLAAGGCTLPVYEIYKAGAPLYWLPGLDLLAPVLPNTVLVGHWNNTDGGVSLDTSCCYMGRERFEKLRALLPAEAAILALDENTGLVIDPEQRLLVVSGKGSAHRLSEDGVVTLDPHTVYSLDAFAPLAAPSYAEYFAPRKRVGPPPAPVEAAVPDEVQRLVDARAEAKQTRDYARADALRVQLQQMGYVLEDTRAGVVVKAAERR